MPVRRTNYDYVAYVKTKGYHPYVITGGTTGKSPEHALRIVKQLSESWNIGGLESISIYEVDEKGDRVSTDPVAVDCMQGPLLLPGTSHDVTKDEPKLHDLFKEADWLSQPVERETYQTATPKGERNA